MEVVFGSSEFFNSITGLPTCPVSGQVFFVAYLLILTQGNPERKQASQPASQGIDFLKIKINLFIYFFKKEVWRVR
jgi:hypothetical protein